MPKALVPVAGEPFAFHQLRLLARNGFRHAVFLIGHMGERIVEAVGRGEAFGIDVRYVVDGPVLLGTGGASLKHCPCSATHLPLSMAIYGSISTMPLRSRGSSRTVVQP